LLTPDLRLGLVGTRPTGDLALMSQQHEVVNVIYCQSLSVFVANVWNQEWTFLLTFYKY